MLSIENSAQPYVLLKVRNLNLSKRGHFDQFWPLLTDR